jgi:hypothetical protein
MPKIPPPTSTCTPNSDNFLIRTNLSCPGLIQVRRPQCKQTASQLSSMSLESLTSPQLVHRFKACLVLQKSNCENERRAPIHRVAINRNSKMRPIHSRLEPIYTVNVPRNQPRTTRYPQSNTMVSQEFWEKAELRLAITITPAIKITVGPTSPQGING